MRRLALYAPAFVLALLAVLSAADVHGAAAGLAALAVAVALHIRVEHEEWRERR